MTLVVDLGLERYNLQPRDLTAALTSLVKDGHTTLVREVLDLTPDGGRVFEARRDGDEVTARWLEPAEAAPILDAVRQTYAKHSTYASFSWDELERIGAYDIQSLALTLDGAVKPRSITLRGDSDAVRVADLERSAANWSARTQQARIAAAFHVLARKHRLIVHSA